MSEPRGHSNVRIEEVTFYSTTQARIPIEGGSDVYKVRRLPPLILTRDEWDAIGQRMGWTRKATPKDVKHLRTYSEA